MKKRAILFTEVYAAGGQERFIADAVMSLRGEYDFHFIFNRGNDRLERFCRDNGFGFTALPLYYLGPVGFKPFKIFSPFRKYLYFMLNYRRIGAALKRYSGADLLLVVNGGYPASDACRIASMTGRSGGMGKVLHFVLSTPTVYLNGLPIIKHMERAIDKRVAAGTDIFVPNAEAIAVKLREVKGFGNVATLHTGIRLPAEPVVRETSFNANGFSAERKPGDLWMGMVSLLAPLKGHSYLLEAMRILKAEGRNVKCIIAGSGPLENSLRAEVARAGLGDRVFLPGRLSDEEVERLYRFIDIFVFPSLQEGLPYSVTEAMGHSLPVVAFAVGGIPEQIESGVTGYTVEPGNAAKLASRIGKFIADPELLRICGTGARRKAEEEFSLEAMESGLKQLL